MVHACIIEELTFISNSTIILNSQQEVTRTLEIGFAQAVTGGRLDIYETYVGGFVVKVEAQNSQTSEWIGIWETNVTANIVDDTNCPGIFNVPVPTAFPTQTFRISTLADGYEGVDAFKLHTPDPTPAPTLTPSMSPATRTPITISPSFSPVTKFPSHTPSTIAPSPAPSLTPSSLSPLTVSPSLSPSSVSPSSLSPSSLSPSSLSPSSLSPSSLSPSSLSPIILPTVSPSLAPTSTPTTAPTTAPTRTRSIVADAFFDEEFAHITLEFRNATNIPPSRNCTRFFQSSDLGRLGAQPACNWVKRDTLRIDLGRGWSLATHDEITIAGGVISLDDGDTFEPAAKAFLRPPATFRNIEAVLNGLDLIGTCATELRIGTGTSVGAGGRPFTSYRWSYSGPDAEIGTLVNASRLASLSLNATAMTVGAHTFHINLTNWLGYSGTSNFTVQKVASGARVNSEVPPVLLPSVFHIQAIPSQPVIIPARVSASCPSTTAGPGVWMRLNGKKEKKIVMMMTTMMVMMMTTQAVSIDRYIPSNTLLAGATYAFNFVAKRALVTGGATAETLLGAANYSFIISVGYDPLSASILGGSFRKIPSTDTISFEVTALGGHPGSTTSYKWSVEESAPAQQQQQTSGGTGTAATLNITSNTASVLLVPSSLLASNTRYLAKVRVSDNATNTNIEASQAFEVVLGLAPAVTIARRLVVDSSGSSSTVDGATGTRVDAASKLSFEAITTATTTSSLEYRWECTSGNFNASQRSNLLAPTNAALLVLRPGSLLAGAAYELLVSVTDAASGLTGAASFSFTTNSAPSLGECRVAPATGGVEMTTTYRLECAEWADEDLPLSYLFGIKATTSGSVSSVTFGAYRDIPYYDTLLPAATTGGASSSAPELVLEASVRDSLGAITSVEMRAEVLPSEISLNAVLQEIEASVEEGDIGALMVWMTSASQYIGQNSSEEVQKMLAATEELSSFSNDGSPEASVRAPLTLASLITQAVEAGTLTPTAQNTSLRILESASQPVRTNFSSPDDARLAVLALSRVARSVSSGMSARGDRVALADRVERALLRVSEGQATSVLAGEDPVGVVVTGGIELQARKMSKEDAGGSSIVLASGARIVAPASLPLEGVRDEQDDVVMVVSAIPGMPMFPSASAPSQLRRMTMMQAGTIRVMLEKADKSLGGSSAEIGVESLAQPFHIVFPIMATSSSACVFWNESLLLWSRDGVQLDRSGGQSARRMLDCATTHLTTFSVDIELNTIGESDIKAEAFSYANPVMLFCGLLFAAFALLGVLAHAFDRRVEATSGLIASRFLRLREDICSSARAIRRGTQTRKHLF
eukprot:jgi/Bigna1/73153/fgenesh1_pg.23_\